MTSCLVTVSTTTYWPVYSYDCHDIASLSPDKKYRGILCYGDYKGKLSGFHMPGDSSSTDLYIFKLLDARNNLILYQSIIEDPHEGSSSPDYSWEWQCDQKGCYSAKYEAFLDRRQINLPPSSWHKYRAKINLW